MCGNRLRAPQPAVASNYTFTYPVLPSAAVAAAQHKVRPLALGLVAALVLVVAVGAMTAITQIQKPTVNFCQFSCGPESGPRLLSSSAYQSSAFGYRVEYEKAMFAPTDATATGVELVAPFGYMRFNASSGSDVNGAITGALAALPSSEFQSLQPLSANIPGADIGLVLGSGEVDTATFVPPNGGQSIPVSVAVMAATNGQLTISVVVVGEQDKTDVAALPFDFAANYYYDFSISNTVWPGQA